MKPLENVDRTFYDDEVNAVRFEHPFLPILPAPIACLTIRIDTAASYTVQIPRCTFIIVQNAGANPLIFGVGTMEAVSAVAGTQTKGGYSLGSGQSSIPIYAGNLSNLDFRSTNASTNATVLCFGA